MLVAVAVVLWGINVVLGREPLAIGPRRIWPAIVAFSAALAVALLQLLPYPPDGLAHPLWAEAARALQSAPIPRVSLAPDDTYHGIVRLLTYAGVFWLALQAGRDPRRCETSLLVIICSIAAYATYGLIVEFSGTETIVWLEKVAYRGKLTSTFVNKNSFATYAGLGIIVSTALIGRRGQQIFRQASGSSVLAKVVNVFAELVQSTWYLAIVWLLTFTALLLSQSRGGLLATLFGLGVLLLIIVSRARSRMMAVSVGAATFGLAVLPVLLLSGAETGQRLANIGTERISRLPVYEATIQAIADTPLIGTGLGAFEETFRFYKPISIPVRFEKAHNTYLESALELGIAGAVALLLPIAIAAFLCLRGVWLRRRDIAFPAIGVAATGVAALHSLVDFSLEIPAVMLTYSAVLGLTTAQSWSSRNVG